MKEIQWERENEDYVYVWFARCTISQCLIYSSIERGGQRYKGKEEYIQLYIIFLGVQWAEVWHSGGREPASPT